MMKRTAALMASLALVVSVPSLASDWKSYPGAYCVEVNDTSSEAAYDSLARLRNTAGGNNSFVCGGVKDAGKIEVMSVNVTDLSLTADVSCIGQMRSENGDLGVWTSVAKTDNAPGDIRLDLGSINYNPSRGYHFIRCVIPGTSGSPSAEKSGINSYAVREAN